jgi:acyl-coenzyme A synthetase/AMP-(fatty) acid ligase
MVSTVVGLRDRLALLLAEAPGDAPVIECEGAWWTWADLQGCAGAVTTALDDAGVGSSARVGVVLNNRPEHVAAVVALLASGRCVVTLSGLAPAARLAADVARSEIPVLLAGTAVLGRDGVREAAGGLVLALGSDGTVTPAGGSIAERADLGGTGVAETAIEMLTSGTTGPPKRVRLSTGQLDRALISGGQTPREGRLLSRSAVLVSTPLVHIGGLWGAVSSLYAGRRMVLLEKFSLEGWVDAVERHGLRAAGLVPAGIRTVYDADVDPQRLATLEVVTSGTTSCPAELADAFYRRYGVRVLMVYGATEFAGAVAGWTKPLHEQWWDTKGGSAGRAFSGVSLRVVDPAGVELPRGEVGHLEVRGAQTAHGADTWVRTSDLASLDDDDFLWIHGRADDAIIRGGFKVAPDTVRSVLETHPSVREAAVAGRPDARLGAVPVAGVEVEPGRPRPQASELVEICRAHLSPYEVPRHIVVLDELPRTPSTKVSRVELLEAVEADIERTTKESA